MNLEQKENEPTKKKLLDINQFIHSFSTNFSTKENNNTPPELPPLTQPLKNDSKIVDDNTSNNHPSPDVAQNKNDTFTSLFDPFYNIQEQHEPTNQQQEHYNNNNNNDAPPPPPPTLSLQQSTSTRTSPHGNSHASDTLIKAIESSQSFSPEQLFKLLSSTSSSSSYQQQKDMPLLIDMRQQPDYEMKRIQGSINVNLPTLLLKRYRRGTISNFSLDSFITTTNGLNDYIQWLQYQREKKQTNRHLSSTVIVYDERMDDTDKSTSAWTLVGALSSFFSSNHHGESDIHANVIWLKGGFRAFELWDKRGQFIDLDPPITPTTPVDPLLLSSPTVENKLNNKNKHDIQSQLLNKNNNNNWYHDPIEHDSNKKKKNDFLSLPSKITPVLSRSATTTSSTPSHLSTNSNMQRRASLFSLDTTNVRNKHRQPPNIKSKSVSTSLKTHSSLKQQEQHVNKNDLFMKQNNNNSHHHHLKHSSSSSSSSSNNHLSFSQPDTLNRSISSQQLSTIKQSSPLSSPSSKIPASSSASNIPSSYVYSDHTKSSNLPPSASSPSSSSSSSTTTITTTSISSSSSTRIDLINNNNNNNNDNDNSFNNSSGNSNNNTNNNNNNGNIDINPSPLIEQSDDHHHHHLHQEMYIDDGLESEQEPTPMTENEYAFIVSAIVPGFLYLGPEIANVEQMDGLKERSIQRILNMAEECDDDVPGLKETFKYSKLAARDTVEMQNVESTLRKAVTIINEAKKHHEPIYVHCKAGKSRSVAVILAYFVITEKWTLKRAYRHVIKARPWVSPNIGFVAELMKLEEKVLGQVSNFTTADWHKLDLNSPPSPATQREIGLIQKGWQRKSLTSASSSPSSSTTTTNMTTYNKDNKDSHHSSPQQQQQQQRHSFHRHQFLPFHHQNH
ncbi:hypothetical protein BJ944DRAFT_253271 [Cunninghamella echinulata]|nr:hypothetical protein BJ944DRAFT_253271 [Cunninghamella echinulata]